MISGKNQIVRQNNIDSESQNRDELSIDVSDELEQINQSIAKLTLKLNSEQNEYTEFNFSCSNINFDLTPSSSSSASSPSNLLHMDKSPRSTTSSSSPSKSPSANISFEPVQHIHNRKLKEKIVKSSTLNSQINKPLLSTNSVPLTPCVKSNRLANFMRLGHASSFFSRSCPGEELTQNVETQNESRSVPKSDNHQRFKNFLAFKIKSKKHDNSPNSSTYTSVNSVFSESAIPSSSSSSASEKVLEKKSKIGSYDVDLEKLARELILPSKDAPLTSFKPPLQSSKTIDSDSPIINKNRKQIIRSLTQNK